MMLVRVPPSLPASLQHLRSPRQHPLGGNTGNTLSTSNFLANYYGQIPITREFFQTHNPTTTAPAVSERSYSRVQVHREEEDKSAMRVPREVRPVAGGTTSGGGKGTSTSSQSGVVVPPPVAISFATRLDFDAPPIALTELQMTIAREIARSRNVTNPGLNLRDPLTPRAL